MFLVYLVCHILYYSSQAKSIEEAVQEAQSGNAETFLGLTDSIIAIIKYYPVGIYPEGSMEEKALSKVYYRCCCMIVRVVCRYI